MMKRSEFVAVGFVATALLLGGCAAGGGGDNGSAGANGTAGSSNGTAGANGSAGSNIGSAGANGSAGQLGSAGQTGSAGAGTAGATGSAGAGTAGATGSAGATGAAGGTSQPKMSVGCNQPPPQNDKETGFVKHDIMVTGVSQAFISAHTLVASDAPYTFTLRNYFVKLPVGYDETVPYRVQFGGTGCGAGNAMPGGDGMYLPTAHNNVLLISMSYTPTQGATTATNPGSCFADNGTDTPDLPYFDAVLADVEKNYCVNENKVGVTGYSSGAWEALMLGWARAGVIRGIATEAGGLRKNRPPGSNKPVAALMIATNGDTDNPLDAKPTDAREIELGAVGGSQQARDEILARNGCTGTDTVTWDATYSLCKKYTGCPAAYPVVWCVMTTGGHYPAHPPYTPDGMTKFLDTLPDVP